MMTAEVKLLLRGCKLDGEIPWNKFTNIFPLLLSKSQWSALRIKTWTPILVHFQCSHFLERRVLPPTLHSRSSSVYYFRLYLFQFFYYCLEIIGIIGKIFFKILFNLGMTQIQYSLQEDKYLHRLHNYCTPEQNVKGSLCQVEHISNTCSCMCRPKSRPLFSLLTFNSLSINGVECKKQQNKNTVKV